MPLYDAQTWRVSFLQRNMPCKYQKPPISISQQANLLINRNLVCNNRNRLESYLASIGYYRLSAYWYPYLDK